MLETIAINLAVLWLLGRLLVSPQSPSLPSRGSRMVDRGAHALSRHPSDV